MAWAASQGVAPIATWIVLSGELAETPANREFGLAIDVALVERCDEVWLVGGRVSPGMRIEADAARVKGIRVRDLTWMGAMPPEGTW